MINVIYSLGWFAVGVYVQSAWEYFTEEVPRGQYLARSSKAVADR